MAPKRKTHEQYVAEVAAVNPDIEVLGTYVTGRVKIEHRCKTCGHGWRTRPYDIVRGIGCPSCYALSIRASAGKVRSPRATTADKCQAQDLRAQGLTYAAIGNILGRSNGTICRWLNPASAENDRIYKARRREQPGIREYENATRLHYKQNTTHGRAANRAHNAKRRHECEADWVSLSPSEQKLITDLYEACPPGFHVDHILPLSKGGDHSYYNLQILSASENTSKGAKFRPEDQELYVLRLVEIFNNNTSL